MQLKTIRRYPLLLTLLLLGAVAVKAAAAQPPMSVRIDGNLDDAAWKKSRPIEAFQTLKGTTPQAATTGMLLTDANYLYLAFRCEEPKMDKLQTTPEPRDGVLWDNDCIEIFVAPFAQSGNYYHLAIDAGGHVYDAFSQDGKEDAGYDLSVTTKVQKQENSWTLEVAVPLCELGLSHTRSALMNFCREREPVLELSSWHGGFGKPKTWQAVPLSLNAAYNVDTRDWSFGSPTPQYGANNASAGFVSAKTAPVKALLYVQEKQQWKLLAAKAVHSTAGHLTRVALPYLLLPQSKPHGVRLELQSNSHTVFRSNYGLHLPADALVATLGVPYYYSDENVGYVQLNSVVSDASLKTSSIRLTVQNAAGKIVLRQQIQPLRKSMVAGFDISRWRQGTGWVTAELITGGKVLARRKLQVLKRPGPFTKSTL